ncbi:hypothetical protein NLM33_45550 [Bradyrhizobium sp. CCGUVB1N3]|uniref:hypothetical protein n=1 Tax=Bradyrhizobium sp. CCGUVB1N3 TaxID=2949629 RepID=UPI0020B2D44A|nr:hypothetical protein [Bradyrhizobium sp. CCGUVB1N3]MCP3477428.1 hypothetical protein [Bradyrhizobium sp. CCGUVB1N3]
MGKKPGRNADSPEIAAIGNVYSALQDLDASAQLRVLRYAAEMLGLKYDIAGATTVARDNDRQLAGSVSSPAPRGPEDDHSSDDSEGINSVALKWLKRSNLDPKSLQPFFSLGIDEIDLVARAIPGGNKKERMHNVLLLKGVAAYLGTGAARVTFEQFKEACLHYDAYDGANFAAYIRSFAVDAGGSKETGFTLTARGLTAATELLRAMLGQKTS